MSRFTGISQPAEKPSQGSKMRRQTSMKNLSVIFQPRKLTKITVSPVQSTLDTNRVAAVLLGLIVIVGGFIRFQYVARSDFPLNDGGMFYTMTRDLIANHWQIPAATSYNHIDIPFGYPPLGFYLAGFLSTAFGFDLLQIFRFLPFFFNLLSIPAFYLLSRELLRNDAQATYAVLAFAMLPPAFEWLILGGGVTRSPGFLFAILALHEAIKAMRNGKVAHILGAVVCGALTALFHLEMFWLMVISGVFFGLILARNRRGLILGAAFGAGVGLLTAPYWLTVIHLNGLSPFISAFKGNGFNLLTSSLFLFASNFTEETFLTLFGILALFGAIDAILRKKFLVVGWLLVLIILNPRSMNRSSVLPISMLAGMAIHSVVLPGIGKYLDPSIGKEGAGNLIDDLRPIATRTAFGLLLFGALLSGVFRFYLGAPPLLSLSNSQREAMGWVDIHTPATSRFLILPTSTAWQMDRTEEWFPTLADRTSLTTVQGHEWMPGSVFDVFQHLTDRILTCQRAEIACIENLGFLNAGYDYIYVSQKGDSRDITLFNHSVINSLEKNSAFEKVYENTDVIIYRHLTGN
jgi:hypothetical protein